MIVKNRWTNAVIGEFNISAGADLEGANLVDANLTGANLAGANLADANLADADLEGVDLEGAYLADANLAGADLEGAYLAGANLVDANLTGAYLAGANLVDANLTGAYLAGANLADANLADAKGLPPIPVIENLDSKILQTVSADLSTFDMSDWHRCETTHCRAGWAITIAGDLGKEWERLIGPAQAGGMIYKASTGRIPDFYCSTADALVDIKACAAKEGAK